MPQPSPQPLHSQRSELLWASWRLAMVEATRKFALALPEHMTAEKIRQVTATNNHIETSLKIKGKNK